MGLMKYIEPIKTFVLIVLVLLSVTLTFSIWSYSPNYQTIEKTEPMNVVIDKKKTISQVVKPYEMVVQHDDTFRGTVKTEHIDGVYNVLKDSQLSDLSMISEKLSYEKMYALMTANDSISLMFSDEVPMSIFQSILPTVNKKVSGIEFSQMMISLKKPENRINDNELDVYFASSDTHELYSAKLHIKKSEEFVAQQLKNMPKYDKYSVIETSNGRMLYVLDGKLEFAKQQYFARNVSSKIEEFKNALFTNPKIVKTSQDSMTNIDKYSDDRSVMTVYNSQYMLNFASMLGESDDRISKSHLIDNTLSFVNEHGGFTNDYRYESVHYGEQKVLYQLFMSDLPVEPSTQTTSTEIEVKISNGVVSRYARPYYQLETIPDDESNNLTTLKTGRQVYRMLTTTENVKSKDIEDLRLGYSMSFKERDNGAVVFTLEPTWFYKSHDDWITIAPEKATVRGDNDGLE